MQPREETAIVDSVQPVEDAGVPSLDIALRFEDGRVERTRQRPELVPEGLTAGETVSVTRAALYRRWTIARTG